MATIVYHALVRFKFAAAAIEEAKWLNIWTYVRIGNKETFMSTLILVRDRDGKPVANTKVFIKWKDGTSTVWTDGSGSADSGIDGYIVYTQVHDHKHYHDVYTKDTGGRLMHQMK
jgi:hypothetical protein